VLLALLSPGKLGAQKIGEVERVSPSLDAPRGRVLEWTSAEGQEFWYRLPHKIDRNNAPNLVFMLHGTGLNHGWSFWNYPIGNGRFRGNDIVISPDGLTPGQGDTFNFVQNKKDGDQISGLIRQFRGKFPIGKIYLYGHSQGAFFCYWFAGAYTELVDGIVAHAGNVLNVNHNKLAKEKVAIGILHGRADAVVSVDCAIRTEKIYREHGYKNLKMTIVEGLSPSSGHWPLPSEVAKMFDWLDQVNADSPELAASVVVGELAKEEPDLQIVASSTAKARKLSKRLKRGEETKALREKIERLAAFVENVESAHVVAIKEAKTAAKTAKKGSFQPWMAHFRVVNASLAGSSAWRKGLKSEVSKARKQARGIDATLTMMSAKVNKKTLRQAVTMLQKSMYASNADELQKALQRLEDNPPAGMVREDFGDFRNLRSSRKAAIDQGRKKAREITARQARDFREQNAGLFDEE